MGGGGGGWGKHFFFFSVIYASDEVGILLFCSNKINIALWAANNELRQFSLDIDNLLFAIEFCKMVKQWSDYRLVIMDNRIILVF